ncbi:tetratricopeptide repeat protein [Flavobacterium sp. MAH-1]|uniref:Tetratricopeptide repeat protein n=1 Tax=Flavobacterium agri TaxID=2743471 RepID=A0A7Y8Y2C8_9FLAO|nr:tetratricopeptide repeat protein [Flavobacterium agri]NUY81267.1 tetratricopeptide repeat protein [Flavobacterium agri]NYA71291.1 tetratricopeptide repeat protein [Flavobacterium agri]
MNKAVFIFLLLTQVFWAQNGFDKGNELYRKGDFKGAADAYESVLKSKKESAELYFNLGNAYYKLNRVAPAIYNYEKALLLNPNDKEISNNLKFAHKLQIDDVKETPKVGFRKMIEDFTSQVHYNTWAKLAVAGAFLVLLLFVGYYFSGTTLAKRIFFVSMFAALLSIALSVFATIFEKSTYNMERPAIVFASITSAKSEPQKEAQDAFIVHEGTKVYVLESLDGWKKVELLDGNQGWIDQSAIKELK